MTDNTKKIVVKKERLCMYNVKIFISFLCLILISGCATTSSTENYHNATRYYTLHIISEPSGVKIEVNGNYIGETPVDYTVKCSLDPYMYALGGIPM